MTMYESEVEWLDAVEDDYDEIKQAIWDDDSFKGVIREFGAVEALRSVSDFHKMLTTQLKDRGITSPDHSDWAKRTIGLVIRLKSRRQQLRTMIRNNMENGAEIVAQIQQEVESDWTD